MMNHEELTDRQHRILRFLVDEYVETGNPVGSNTLIDNYPLGVSSATVRNEMAVLERLGYIEQPHRSSGRVPTDRGFRLYVERYAASSRLPASDEIMIRHQFRQVESQIDDWLQLAASVLAEVAGNLSIVTSPRNRMVRLRHFELLSLQPRIGLLIVVTQDSAVSQAMVHFEEPREQSELSIVADRLNLYLANKTPREFGRILDDMSGFDRFVGEQLARALDVTQTGQRTEVRHDGIEYMVQQPEFTGNTNLRHIFGLMRGGALLSMLLPQLEEERGVQIFIGEENVADELQHYGIVVASYGVDREVTGLLGIVGPRRMQYDRSISSVRYMSTVMSDLLQDLYYNE
jgi:heat-inducible transcriptional repressor